MEQVRELLALIKGVRTNSGLVVASFIVRRVQPCKERAHPAFEFNGETDGTRERPEMLSRNVVEERVAELFAPFASFNMLGYTKPFNCKKSASSGKYLSCVFLMLFILLHCQAVD